MSVGEAYAVLPFFWSYTSDAEANTANPLTLRACSTITFQTGPNPQSQVAPTPPFSLIVYPASGVPQVLAAGVDGSAANFKVTYKTGTQLLLSFVDSKGLPGGTSPLISVIDGTSSSCVTASNNSSLSLAYTPNVPNTCEPVNMIPSGGKPPYTISIQKSSDQGINVTSVTNNATWVADMQAGTSVIYSLSDSTGTYAQNSGVIFSGGGSDSSCFSHRANSTTPGERPTDVSTSHQGASKGLIGGVIAASVVSAILLIYMTHLLCKRKRRAAQLSHRSSLSGQFATKLYPHSDTSSTLNYGLEKAPPLRATNPDAQSVHSLQLHPFKFRVVNPDPDADTSADEPNAYSRDTHYSPPSSIASYGSRHHRQDPFASPDDPEPRPSSDYTVASSTAHERTESGGLTIANKRRSLKASPSTPSLGSDHRRSGDSYYQPRRDSLASISDKPYDYR